MVTHVGSHDLEKLEGLKMPMSSFRWKWIHSHGTGSWQAEMPASGLAPKCLIFNQRLSSFSFYSWVCFKLHFSLLTKVRIQGSLNQGKKASSLCFSFLTFNFPSLFSFIIFKNSEHIKRYLELVWICLFLHKFFFQREMEINFAVPRVSAGTKCLWWIHQTFEQHKSVGKGCHTQIE